jgi:hypothetical protein
MVDTALVTDVKYMPEIVQIGKDFLNLMPSPCMP